MKQKVKIMLCLCIPMILFICCFSSQVSFSKEEDQILQERPSFDLSSFLDGSYMASYNRYLLDHIPFRSSLLKFETKMEKLMGRREKNNVYFGKEGQLVEKVALQKNGKSLILEINQVQQKFNHINSSLILIPNKIVIYPEYLQSSFHTIDEEKQIEDLYYSLAITDINVIPTFRKNKNKYPLYYKTDASWTSYGAYYAYLEYCIKNNIESIPITSYEIQKTTEDYYGNLYFKTMDSSVSTDSIYRFSNGNKNYQITYSNKKHQNDTLYQTSYLKQNHKKGYFLGEGDPYIKIVNPSVNNKKRLLVVTDGSGNEMIPFLIEHYERIDILNIQKKKQSVSEFLQRNKEITDLLYIVTMNHIDQSKLEVK